MVLSRFRYWASCMTQCKEISDAVWKDVQALVWGKDVDFDADEIGTQGKVRVFANKHNQCNPRREGGVGLLHWPGHSKALAANVLFQYVDGSTQEWKHVLDWWLDRFHEGRGAIFSTIPIVDLVHRKRGRRSRLPDFFKYAIRSLRELPIRPIHRGRFISADEAKAEPFWTSPRLHVTNPAHADQWRYELTLNRLRDFIDPDTDCPWTDEAMLLFIRDAFPDSNSGSVSIYSHRDLFGRKKFDQIPIRSTHQTMALLPARRWEASATSGCGWQSIGRQL